MKFLIKFHYLDVIIENMFDFFSRGVPFTRIRSLILQRESD